MSRTIEQKVVEMRFDNSNFEKNVSQSMDSLNKLQNAIDKTSSGNAFAGLSKAVNNLDFGSVTTAIQTVTEKFSIWEQIAIGAARNIGASLSNYVAKGLNDMVFSNVNAGWDKYAQKTEAVQTIMASIADQDFGKINKMDYVSGILEKLNWFTDETSYHFTDMVSSIGKFTSAGVDLEKASDAMMGIATWAAASGANADTASRVMYQLSQSLGMGAVKLQDWMSVETANMATKEFKELAIQVAKTHKTISDKGTVTIGTGKSAKEVEVTFKNFRETLKAGWMTSDVLTDTLGQYSSAVEILNRTYYALGENVPTSKILPKLEKAFKEAEKGGKKVEDVFTELVKNEWGEELDENFNLDIYNEQGKVIGNLADKVTLLGIRAFRAAQEAKTFGEAMGSVGDAASTIWMNIWEKVFGDYETAKVLWTDLANYLYDIFVMPLWEVSKVVDEWIALDGRDILFGRDVEGDVEEATGAFYIMLETIKNVESAFMEAFGEVFPFGGENLVEISKKIQNFANKTKVTADDVEELTEKITNFLKFFKDIFDSIDIFNKKSEDSINILKLLKTSFGNTFEYAEQRFMPLVTVITTIKDALIGFFDNLKLNEGATSNLEQTFQDLGEIANQFQKAWVPLASILSNVVHIAQNLGKFISGVIQAGTGVIKNITSIVRNTELVTNVIHTLSTVLHRIQLGFRQAFDKSIFTEIKNGFAFVWTAIKNFIDGFKINRNVFEKIQEISKGIASAINLVGRAVKFLLKPIQVLDGMGVFGELGKFLSETVLNALLSIPATIGKIITKINEFIKTHPRIQEIWDGISTIFGSLIKFVMGAGTAFSDFIEKTKPLSKVGQFVRNIFDAFKQSTVLTIIGKKISDAFDKIVAFFRDKFYFDAFKNKMNEIGEAISNFVDKSFILSSVRNALKSVWDGIKKMFSADADFSGFVKGFDAVSGAIIRFVKTIWSGVKGVGKFIFSIFGGKSPEDGLDGVSEEVESFGEKVEDTIDTTSATITNISDDMKVALDSIKESWDRLGIGEWADKFFGSIRDTIAKAKEQFKPVGNSLAPLATEAEGTTTGVKRIFDSLMKVFGTAIPTFLAGSFISGLMALTHPITALGDVVNTLLGTIRSYMLSERIKAIGDAVSDVLKSLGLFVLAIAGAALVLAYAEKVSGGNLTGIYIALGGFIAEVIGAIVIMMKSIASMSKITSEISLGGGASAKLGKNHIAETVSAIGDVFRELGTAMLKLAASVAILIAMDKFNPGALWKAAGIIEIFMVTLLGLGILVMELTDDTQTFGLGLNKSGLKLEGAGYVEGLYLIGAFMDRAATAILLLAASAALIMTASKGDTKTMAIAFAFMETALVTLLGGALLIMAVSKKMDKFGNTGKTTMKLSGFASFFIAAALALNIIAKTAVMLGSQKDTDIDKGVSTILKIGLLMVALTFVAGAMKNGKYKSVGFMLLEAAIALAIIGSAVDKIAKIDDTGMQKAMDIIIATGVIFGVLIAVSSLTNSGALKFVAFGATMIGMASSFILMAAAVKILASINPSQVDSVIGMLYAMVGAMTIMTLVMALSASNSLGMLAASVALIAMAVALDLVIAGIVAAGLAFSQNEGALEEAVGAIILAVAAIAALSLIATLAGPSLLIFGAGLIAIGLGLSAIAASILIISLALTALTTALKIVLTMGDAIVDAMKTFFKAIAKAAPELTDALIAIVGGIVVAIAENIEGILDIVLNLLNGILKLLADWLPTLLENLTIIINAIVDLLLNILLNAVRTLFFGEDGILAMVYDALFGEAGLMHMIDEFISGEHGIINIIINGIVALLEGIRKLAGSFAETVVYLIQTMLDALASCDEIIYQSIKDTIIRVATHLVELSFLVVEAIAYVINGLAEAIRTGSGEIYAAIKNLLKAIWDAIWGIFGGDQEGSVASLAKNFVEGFAKGLVDNVKAAVDAALSFGKKVLSAVGISIDAHSPSRETEKLGEYFVQGFTNGISDNTGSAFGSALNLGNGVMESLTSSLLGDNLSGLTEGLGDGITDALSGSLGGMSDLLNTDDFTPTITPVLDLSELQNGASKISGMINPGSGYTVDTSIVSKSAYNPYEYYDGTVKTTPSEVQMDYFEKLKAKMDEVVNKFGNAKVVLDTGAVVGGIVDPMDMALGQRMAQVGRGVISSTR